jgi:hypothetical protein
MIQLISQLYIQYIVLHISLNTITLGWATLMKPRHGVGQVGNGVWYFDHRIHMHCAISDSTVICNEIFL